MITGASSGIGAALAESFAERGAVVGICARREDRLRDVLERVHKHSPESRSWVVDLSEIDGVEAFARRADDELGGIDVLVNNAGIPKRRPVTKLAPAVVEAVMALNYLSPVRLTLALPKAALTAFSEAMAVDLADTGVKVHVVNPGIIDTELFRLPDNDEPIADMSMALPVDALVQPVVDQLDSGTFEIYVPTWFQEIVAGKVADPDGFLRGSIEYLRSRRASS